MKKTLNTATITNELRDGSAFFRQSELSPETELAPSAPANSSKPVTGTPPSENQAGKPDHQLDENVTDNQPTQQTDQPASHMTILQLDDTEIEELREPAYQAQTFRLTKKEIEWAKDTAYRLSKEVKRGKVSQADILRIAFKLFENLLAVNKTELMQILNKIK